MKLSYPLLSRALLPLFCAALCACAVDASPEDDIATSSEAILGGTSVTAQYPEAATINSVGGSVPPGTLSLGCSGTLIAPRVVLTAGHCVNEPRTWEIHVGSAAAATTRARRFDWPAGSDGDVFHGNLHDVGLLFLDQPIVLASYPTIAQTAASTTASLKLVGRVHDGVATNTLWGAASSGVFDGATDGFPSYYIVAPSILEHGDSGGPVFLSGTHTIVAVNSASGWSASRSAQVNYVARVDQLFGWITRRIDDSTFFVQQGYLDLLGRDADAGGLAYFVSALDACNGATACLNSTRTAVVRSLLESPEKRQKSPDLDPSSPSYKSAYVTHCYTDLLQRQPDSAGYTFWVNTLTSTGDYSAVVSSFITSAEYRQRFGM